MRALLLDRRRRCNKSARRRALYDDSLYAVNMWRELLNGTLCLRTQENRHYKLLKIVLQLCLCFLIVSHEKTCKDKT